jgi:hypothetical protein
MYRYPTKTMILQRKRIQKRMKQKRGMISRWTTPRMKIAIMVARKRTRKKAPERNREGKGLCDIFVTPAKWRNSLKSSYESVTKTPQVRSFLTRFGSAALAFSHIHFLSLAFSSISQKFDLFPVHFDPEVVGVEPARTRLPMPYLVG